MTVIAMSRRREIDRMQVLTDFAAKRITAGD
jgi:hypothetical protein